MVLPFLSKIIFYGPRLCLRALPTLQGVRHAESGRMVLEAQELTQPGRGRNNERKAAWGPETPESGCIIPALAFRSGPASSFPGLMTHLIPATAPAAPCAVWTSGAPACRLCSVTI